MNTKQKAEIIELVNTDCESRHLYFDLDGKTCVIGKMASVCGFGRDDFNRNMGQAITAHTLQHIASTLCDRFGLTVPQLAHMQCINDASRGGTPDENLIERRKAIVKYLDSLPVVEE